VAGPFAWRLTFAYQGDSITLLSQERVEMTAPPSDDQDLGGVQLQVLDSAGRVVWHKRVLDPIARSRAVYSPDPDEPIRRVDMPVPEGAFQVVVPDLPGAETFVLRGATPTPGGTARRAAPQAMAYARATRQEMVRVPLNRPPGRTRGNKPQ